MSSRRDRILDTAIETVAEGGIRALTHRAVDAGARLPTGSTSNLFRTREALLVGLVERFCERELAAQQKVARQARPTTPTELGQLLGDIAVAQVTTDRALTLTRYAVLVEAATTPAVRDALSEGGRDAMGWATTWARLAGSRRPEHDAAVAANWLAGLVLHQLANPADHFRPHEELTELLTMLITRGNR